MIELEQLKRLVFDGGFDADSRKAILNYESQLAELLVKEKAIEIPVIKEYADYLQFQIDHAEQQLITNRQLTDRERDALFAKIDICKEFLSVSNGQAREAIRQSIIQDLDNARTQHRF